MVGRMFGGFETHSEVKSLSQVAEIHHKDRLVQLITDGKKAVFVSLPKIPVGTAAVANGSPAEKIAEREQHKLQKLGPHHFEAFPLSLLALLNQAMPH